MPGATGGERIDQLRRIRRQGPPFELRFANRDAAVFINLGPARVADEQNAADSTWCQERAVLDASWPWPQHDVCPYDLRMAGEQRVGEPRWRNRR